MCGGLASVAGSVLAGYASMGVKMEYLIAASFMAAPGGLLFAKLLVPETETPSYDENTAEGELDDKPANVIDAAAAGASAGLQLALNVGAMLLAFIGLIAMISGIFSGVGGWFGYPQLSWNCCWAGCSPAGLPDWRALERSRGRRLLHRSEAGGERVRGLPEFRPYLKDEVLINGVAMSEHTKAIISFALCGFANLSSVAILLGGLGSMAPNRRGTIAKFGLKAVLAGSLSNLMSATIAGFFLALSGM